MASNSVFLQFNDCSELKKCNIKKKSTNEVLSKIYSILYPSEPSSSNQSPKLSFWGDSVDNEKILYPPRDSFSNRPYWTAGRYIGETTLNIKEGEKTKTYRLQIKPRFGMKFFIHMLEEIHNFKMAESDKKNVENGAAWNDFLKIIMRFLWIAKFSQADKYGLPRKTAKLSQQSIRIRGHLNVRKSIIPLFTKGTVVSEYYEKQVDEAIGKIVYKAYTILADRKNGLKNIPSQVQDSINDLYVRYHGQQIQITETDYQKIQYKNIFLSWKPLVDLSWQIIKHKGIDLENTAHGKGYSLFFDIAEIWEAYIAKLLKKSFTHFTSNNSNISLFENDSEENFQKIIPDYISNDYTIGGKQEVAFATAVGDAKYMDLKDIENLPAEKASAVYYKTIMYMQRFNCKRGFLFYPISHEYKENEDYTKIKSEPQKFKIVGTNASITKIGLNVFHTEKEKLDNEDSFNELVLEQEKSFVETVENSLAAVE